MPTVNTVSVAVEIVQTDVVLDTRVTVRPDDAVGVSGIVEVVNGCDAGPVNEIV